MTISNSTPSPLPKYIYKILPPSPSPYPLPLSLPVSPLDARDNFIHMSTSVQLLGTLNKFFAKKEGDEGFVWILRVRYADVEGLIKWEDSKGKGPEEVGGCWDISGQAGYFPHIYNGLKLGSEEVESVGKWVRVGEVWGPEGWPFDEDAPKA